jgi:tetratricopeptide (TPR) repeat protein
MDIAPQYSYLPYNLGLLYDRLGDTASARHWFEAAGKTAEAWPRKKTGTWPEMAQVLNALGTLAVENRAPERAKGYFLEARTHDPRNPNVRNNLALLMATQKNYVEADKLWRSVIDDFPDFTASRVALARSLEQRGDRVAATAQYREILKADPGWTGAHEALARLYYSTGDYPSALNEIDQALSDLPSSPSLVELRGDTLFKLHRRSEAADDWKSALLVAPDRNAVRRISKKLRDEGAGR